MTTAADLRKINDLQKLTNEIQTYFTNFTGIKLTECNCMCAPHRPSTLINGQEQGVYVFIVDSKHCLKVGCTGDPSRWSFQHYKFDLNVKSTLPKSIQRDPDGFNSFLANTKIADKTKELTDVLQDAAGSRYPTAYSTMIREWLETYTTRLEFKMPAWSSDCRFAGKFLESTLHFVLKPLFEG